MKTKEKKQAENKKFEYTGATCPVCGSENYRRLLRRLR